MNIVVLEENYKEIDRFINWGVKASISVDLMFLDINSSEYSDMQKMVLNKLINMYGGEILLKTTPVIKIE